MVNYPNPNIVSPLRKFHDAPKKLEGEGENDFGSAPGGDGSDRRPSAGDNELHEDYMPLDRSSEANLVNYFTGTGIRPEGLGLSATTVTTVIDGVCVTAVVDVQKQSAAFENAYAESIAYNSKRDRPVYQFVQVQRREVSDNGDESEWQDISEDVAYRFAQYNPLTRMPLQVYGSAPEVVSPDHFDPILTQAIPALAQLDYQTLASHPALKMSREFPAWKAPDVAVEAGAGTPIFNNPSPKDKDDGDDINVLRAGTNTTLYEEAIVKRKPGGQYRLVRFFDLAAAKEKSFEYRVRVWVGDPSQLDPSDGFLKNRGQQLQAADGEKKGNSKEDSVRWSGAADGVGGVEDLAKQGGDDTSDTLEVVVDVRPTMLVPPARIRISQGTDLDTMQERLEAETQRLAKVARGDGGDKDGNEFQPFHVGEYSADGQLEQIELPPSPGRYAYMQYLRYARPSAWSESVRVKSELPTADVLAGATQRQRSVAMQIGRRTVEFELAEPSFKVLVSFWDRALGARLPAERDAYIGETMNFRSQAYVTHPITRQIKIPEAPNAAGIEKYKLPFRTNVTIVDAFFGTRQELPGDKRLSMEGPTEILTMDANGKFKISNQFNAANDYRNELVVPDDSRFFGRPPRQRKSRSDEDEDDSGDFN